MTVMAKRVTIFLTGACGVVGAALLQRLREHRVIALVHHALPLGGEHLPGDLSQPRLGLGPRVYADLCQAVDAVVHCGPPEQSCYRVLELCAAAHAPLLHVSSAFHRQRHADEALLASCGLRHVIARPSIVIGDSQTGEIARFSGFHSFATRLLRGRVSCLNVHAESSVDLVPQDVVACCLRAILDSCLQHGFDAREYWLTAGSESPTIGRLLELVREAGAFADLEVTLPQLLPHPSTVPTPPLQSSLGTFAGSPAKLGSADIEQALSASLDYLLRAKSLGIHAKRYRLVQPSYGT